MEKQRKFKCTKFCRRLLAFIFVAIFINSQTFSQKLSKKQIEALRIEPSQNQNLYAKQEIKFEVILPGIASKNVQIQNPTFENNVTFNTLRKTEVYTNQTNTKIELWLTFSQKGTYNLPKLTVLINEKKQNLQFERITIDDNPLNKSPRIVIKFDNGKTVFSDDSFPNKILFSCEAGKKLSYTVFLQYAVQLIQFDWDLPEDSILTQTQTYEITEIKYREKKVNDDLIPVASFEWTELSIGEHFMPNIKITATDYNGYRNVITTQNFLINFTNPILKNDSKSDSLFVEAFNKNYIHETQKDFEQISDEDCEKLAELRQKEKHSFFGNAKQERKDFEKQLNLPVTQNEFPVWLFYFSILILIIFVLILIIFIKTKKILAQILTTVALICAFSFFVFSTIRVSQKFAILKNGTIYSIPENSASSANPLSSATRVRILKETEEWCFIEVGEISGWVKKDEICFI